MVVDVKAVMEILEVMLVAMVCREEVPMVWRGLGGGEPMVWLGLGEVPMVWHVVEDLEMLLMVLSW